MDLQQATIDRIQDTMAKHQNDPRFGLSAENIQSINSKLKDIEDKIKLVPKTLTINTFGMNISV